MWRYRFDDGLLVAACDPRDNAVDGSCTRYEHDAVDNPEKRITKVTRPRGNTAASLAYDDKGRLQSLRGDGLGNTITYTYPDPPQGISTACPRGWSPRACSATPPPPTTTTPIAWSP